MASKFLYFSYGSNLLAHRIHINNPTAVRRTIGKLENYRLDFNAPSYKTWGGCPATIVPHKNKHVWGAVWEIDKASLPDLDRQEGVHEGIYFPIQVNVTSPHGEVFECVSYQLVNTPPFLDEGESLPLHRRPSQIYLQVIIGGAKESQLPAEYIRELENIPHNGFKGPIEVPLDINKINLT